MQRGTPNPKLGGDPTKGKAPVREASQLSRYPRSWPALCLSFGAHVPRPDPNALHDQAPLQFGHGTGDREDHAKPGDGKCNITCALDCFEDGADDQSGVLPICGTYDRRMQQNRNTVNRLRSSLEMS
jgi:hypothetical protein